MRKYNLSSSGLPRLEQIRDASIAIVSVALFQSMLLPASGQTSSLTMQGPPSANMFGAGIIKDGLNRPCLSVEAAARRQRINTAMIDHIVSVKNNCPRSISAKICYKGVEQCTVATIVGYARVDTVLGTMREITQFEYTIVQK